MGTGGARSRASTARPASGPARCRFCSRARTGRNPSNTWKANRSPIAPSPPLVPSPMSWLNAPPNTPSCPPSGWPSWSATWNGAKEARPWPCCPSWNRPRRRHPAGPFPPRGRGTLSGQSRQQFQGVICARATGVPTSCISRNHRGSDFRGSRSIFAAPPSFPPLCRNPPGGISRSPSCPRRWAQSCARPAQSHPTGGNQ